MLTLWQDEYLTWKWLKIETTIETIKPWANSVEITDFKNSEKH